MCSNIIYGFKKHWNSGLALHEVLHRLDSDNDEPEEDLPDNGKDLRSWRFCGRVKPKPKPKVCLFQIAVINSFWAVLYTIYVSFDQSSSTGRYYQLCILCYLNIDYRPLRPSLHYFMV